MIEGWLLLEQLHCMIVKRRVADDGTIEIRSGLKGLRVFNGASASLRV